MCGACISRRAFALGAAALPLAGGAARAHEAGDAVVDVRMRLAVGADEPPAVALTLDACGGRFDERIAEALVESNTPATIFVTGIWMRANPVGLRFLLAHSDLFALENHGQRHVPAVLGEERIFGIPVAGTMAAVEREVMEGAVSVTTATGRRPAWYRSATARYSVSVIPEIRRLGFQVAGYSLNADAGAVLGADRVTARIAKAANGDVILAHFNKPDRPSGPGIAVGMAELRRRGMRFVRLDQVSGAGVVFG
jgi:peptidoglycan/xylan/chitin deacetylase (PgdA/CDA1 family)